MPNTLGLWGDLDDLELLRDIEASFDVSFCDDEPTKWFTVGDVFAALEREFSVQASAGGKCATSMAFFRLRRALTELGVEGRLKPDFSFSAVKQLSPRRLIKELEKRSGLRLPSPTLSYAGAGLLLLAFTGLVASFFIGNGWLILCLLAVLVLGFPVIGTVDRGMLPMGSKTLGGLARAAATRNYGRLVGEGAGMREGDLWRVFCDLLADHTALPKDEIARETLLIGKRTKAA
jgi:hypothetical protein